MAENNSVMDSLSNIIVNIVCFILGCFFSAKIKKEFSLSRIEKISTTWAIFCILMFCMSYFGYTIYRWGRSPFKLNDSRFVATFVFGIFLTIFTISYGYRRYKERKGKGGNRVLR